mgnify:CR=1 FL=1
MPLLKSTFLPSLPFRNGHFNTIYRPLFMKEGHNYKRKRINTWDNDFLDLDFSTIGSNTLVIALHGLEGSSKSNYIVSLVNHLNSLQIDCVAVNFRGCSGEDNNHLHSYNSGKTDDVSLIINHILITKKNKYFSLLFDVNFIFS